LHARLRCRNEAFHITDTLYRRALNPAARLRHQGWTNEFDDLAGF
jgi:hypothetical protein